MAQRIAQKTRIPRFAVQFWNLADLFRDCDQPWFPTSAGYEWRSLLEVEGKKWTACFKVHALTEWEPQRVSAGRTMLKASVTLWAPDLSDQQRRRLSARGWFSSVRDHLKRLGYEGRWRRAPFGLWADFWKDLRNLADVRREVRSLGRVALYDATAWASKNGPRRR